MTSLPMPTGWTEPVPQALSSGALELNIGNAGINLNDERFLLRAFRSFAEAAESLERSYGMLRAEVERLRRELERSNSDLARSLEENRGMRVHLDRVLEGLPCGVLVASSDGEISRANPEALRLLGFENPPAAPLGNLSRLPAGLGQLLECARREAGEQEWNVPGGGAARWLAARHASFGDHCTSYSVFILRDVSERKRLEEAQARLRREQALAEMSAVLAHEIRNPLGSLELFAGLLAESEQDAECRNWVEQVQAGLRILSATVNNVLHFHSLPEPERSSVDLGQLLDWARDFFLPLARQSGVTLSLQNRLAGALFSADRHRLEQVLLNLMLNALRAMPEGGWLQLSAGEVEQGRMVAITVADTGPGIFPEHLPRIFEPGFSTRAGSPGLGLAVCRKIVEQHGGTIGAESSPGRGAKFTLTFPLTSRISGVAE
jgi:two-component system, sensor histidine kinase FlrB